MSAIWDVSGSLLAGEMVRVLPDHRQRADVWAVSTSRLATSAKVRVCVQFLQQCLTQGPHALVTRC